MNSYACYVHLAGEKTPQLRFLNSDGGAALVQAVGGLVHEWPDFTLIDVRDDTDRTVVRYLQSDRAGLLRH